MSRDIQIYNQGHSHLPQTQDDLFRANALGMPSAGGNSAAAAAADSQNSPLRKIQRLLRGREKLAITLAVCGALIGGVVGWFSQKPQWVSSGVVWIRPIIPSLSQSDKVMPFYQYYVQSQTAIISGPRVLERAVQSNEWKAAGLPANSDSIATIKQELDVVYAKNSQHILVSYTDVRPEVAQAAVRSVIQAYRDIYSDANGQEMKSKLTAIEAKREELDSAIRGIQGQMRALVEKHGHDDLSVIYNDSQRRLMDLREKVRSTQMKLESAMAGAPKDGDKNADPTKGITIEMIAQIDVTMRQYIQTLEAMEFQLQRLARTVGTKNPAYTQAAADVELQKQRINTYAEAFRRPRGCWCSSSGRRVSSRSSTRRTRPTSRC